MAAIETSLANAFETQLTANVTGSDLTFPVASIGSLTSPTYLVIDPDNPTKREYVFFDGTFTSTDLVTTALANRGLAGSASGAQGHTKGAKVRAVPMQQHFEDLHDRMDTAYTVGGADVAVADGGTGASTAPVARTNLGAAADAEVVHLAGAETITGAKTFSTDPTLADGSSALSLTEGNAAYLNKSSTHNLRTITLTFDASDTAPNSGTQGLRIERDSFDLPLGLTLVHAGTEQWDVVELDFETNDLVVIGDHFSNGEGSLAAFADQMRFAHGGHGEFGRSVGLQTVLRRFEFSSDSGDNASMANLLVCRIKAGSPVTFPFRIMTGEWGSTTDVFRVSTAGAVVTPSTISASGITSSGSSVGPSTSVGVSNGGTGGRMFRMTAGVEGVTDQGFSIRDTTAAAARVVITNGGTMAVAGRASSADIATTATAGFLMIPQCNGAPSGVPESINASSGGAMVFNRSANKLHVYVNGVGWKEVALV